MVILLNNGNNNILDSVFWYRPTIIPEESAIRLCHPAVWKHASTRTDEAKLDHVALLSCYSADD